MITATHVGKMLLLVFAFTVLSLTKHTEGVLPVQKNVIDSYSITIEKTRAEIKMMKKDIKGDILIIRKKMK
jgi:hypothetical protein